MNSEYQYKLNKFKSINLTELNSTASFLKRIDRKYLLNAEQFWNILDDLVDKFDVLEIADKKVFSYDNVYMDTPDYLFYNQHQNKLKSRTKIRTRYYVDSNLAFFEYKQKNDWVTNKFRYQFPSEEHGFMTRGKKRFFDWVWQSVYGWKKAPEISPSIKTSYKRITMVSKNWEERLTIDFNIKALNLRKAWAEMVDLKNLVIVESKSLKSNCQTCKIMRNHEIKRAKSCSKYSLWVVYSGLAEKFDTFKDTMEKIKEIRMETIKNKERTWGIQEILKDFERIKEEALV